MKSRFSQKVIASILGITASVGVLNGSSPALAAESATLPVGCTPVQILAFRGSGEPKNKTETYSNTTMTTNGWEGETLRRLLQAYVAQSHGTAAPNPNVDTVPVKAIGPDEFGAGKGYPAAKVPRTIDIFTIKKAIGDSARAGAATTASYIDETVKAQTDAGCPSPQFIVLGYSQGAISARWVTQLRPANIALTEIYGDPLQFQSQTGNHVTGSDGNGFLRYISTDAEKIQDNKYYRLPSSQSALCHEGDPFCDYNWLLGAISIVFGQYQEHLNYVTGAAEVAEEGKTMSRMVGRLVAASTTGGRGLKSQRVIPERNYLDDIDMNTLMADPDIAVVQPDTAEANLAPFNLQATGESSASYRSQGLSAREDSTVRIQVTGIQAGQQFGLRLTQPTTKGSWRLPAIWTSPIYTSSGERTQTIVPTFTGIEPGTYTASIFTNRFTHTPDTTITITRPVR